MRTFGSLLVIALAVATGTGSAQGFDKPLPPARFGLTAGLNLSTFAGDGLGATSNRRGFVGGVDLVTPFSQIFSTQLEALYSMKGMKSLKLNYLAIPVTLRADAPTQSVKPFGFTGPAFNVRVSCGADAVSNGTTTSATTSATCDQLESAFSNGAKFRTFDVGWVFGGGLGFDVHDRRVSLGARYEMGLRTITSPGTSKNRALSFMASVEAPLPRRTSR